VEISIRGWKPLVPVQGLLTLNPSLYFKENTLLGEEMKSAVPFPSAQESNHLRVIGHMESGDSMPERKKGVDECQSFPPSLFIPVR
jgi:hypothetical protein